jgi:hypothetical protein
LLQDSYNSEHIKSGILLMARGLDLQEKADQKPSMMERWTENRLFLQGSPDVKKWLKSSAHHDVSVVFHAKAEMGKAFVSDGAAGTRRVAASNSIGF